MIAPFDIPNVTDKKEPKRGKRKDRISHGNQSKGQTEEKPQQNKKPQQPIDEQTVQQARKERQQQRQQRQEKAKSNLPQSAEPAPQAPPVSEIASLFSHIHKVKKWTSKELLEKTKAQDRDYIHPALLEYALQAAQNLSLDEDERTRIFLRMMIQQIQDEPIQDGEKYQRTIFNLIKRTMGLLSLIRMTPIGIGNAVRFLKVQCDINNVHTNHLSNEELKSFLIYAIEHFIEDKIDDVFEYNSRTTANTILDGDVILTYGWSPVICSALKQAQANGKKFRVIVVDSRPNFDSRILIEQISEIDVRYVLISGLSYVMPEVKKVLIEPCGILSNNAAQTPIGTAMISMVAHECGVPVIFVCGSYRFVSDVRIDALSKNEIIEPEFMQPVPRSDIIADPEYLSLTYDVTPGQYVDIVICELGNIPVNSISTNIKFIQDSYTMFSRPNPKQTAK